MNFSNKILEKFFKTIYLCYWYEGDVARTDLLDFESMYHYYDPIKVGGKINLENVQEQM